MISFCCKPQRFKEGAQISRKYTFIIRNKGNVPADITVCCRYDSNLETVWKTGFITHNL